jgi:hypothetical protein
MEDEFELELDVRKGKYFNLSTIQLFGFKQCRGSGMFIRDPYLCPYRIPDLSSRIPDPKTPTKEMDEKKFLSYLFCSHKYHKSENYFIFDEEKNLGLFTKIKELSNQKIFTNPSKNRFEIWDPEKPISDPGFGVKNGIGSRIWISNIGFKVFITHLLDFSAVWYFSPIFSVFFKVRYSTRKMFASLLLQQ